jgi:hypothetical protein
MLRRSMKFTLRLRALREAMCDGLQGAKQMPVVSRRSRFGWTEQYHRYHFTMWPRGCLRSVLC